MSDFTDVKEPTSLLHAPKAPEEFSQGPILDTFNDCADLMSPTYWVTEAYNAVFGYNPLDEVVQWFAGDWESFAKCGDVWDQFGKAVAAVSDNVEAGNKTLDITWDGRAGDAAYKYFFELAGKLDEVKDQFDKLKTEYDHLSHAAYSTAEAIKGFLGGIIDGLLITAIEISAGTLLSWTGIGAAVGYGLAALEVANMLRLWAKATEAFGNAQAIVNGAVGVIETIAATLYGSLSTFPEVGAYDHPEPSI
ncbi:hypothetical protein [Streptomyces xanthii]|uniref:Uncharacterized protein n=1 Tax=Streptomyces xanthii TaxID=2768069 RepID=A0A7H1B4W5_9ACTN|nr:hypothetical protein [Streptomyces xanthii]QNS03770.1 hypothetical protein IAG42_09120 [Streptomyces xanthii]